MQNNLLQGQEIIGKLNIRATPLQCDCYDREILKPIQAQVMKVNQKSLQMAKISRLLCIHCINTVHLKCTKVNSMKKMKTCQMWIYND